MTTTPDPGDGGDDENSETMPVEFIGGEWLGVDWDGHQAVPLTDEVNPESIQSEN